MSSKKDSQTILVGAVLGALAGAALAIFWGRWRQQQRTQGKKALTTGQVVRLGSSIVSVVRQFLDMLS